MVVLHYSTAGVHRYESNSIAAEAQNTIKACAIIPICTILFFTVFKCGRLEQLYTFWSNDTSPRLFKAYRNLNKFCYLNPTCDYLEESSLLDQQLSAQSRHDEGRAVTLIWLWIQEAPQQNHSTFSGGYVACLIFYIIN